MYVIIYSDGQISLDDFSNDCHRGSWVPIAVLKYKCGKMTVPCFNDPDTAKSFAHRNLPKSWIKGTVLLHTEDFDSLSSRGFIKEVYDFPRLVKDRVDCEMTFEILEFTEQPDLLYLRT